MSRVAATVLGLAILGGGAIFISRALLSPATEEAERRTPVLTGALDPQLHEFRVLEDNELPAGLLPPKVGEDLLYLLVVVLYPGSERVPSPDEHILDRVNNHPDYSLRPAHVESVVDRDGAYLYLTIRTDSSFEFARLVRDGEVVIPKVSLQ